MGNPLVNQGVFNRVRASIKFTQHPELNITAPFLTQDGIDISFQGGAGLLLPTMTGGAPSPQPYQMVEFKIHLVRSQSMAALFKKQIELDTMLGDATCYTDTSTLGDFSLRSTVIKTMQDMSFSGREPGCIISLLGIYDVNSSLWDF